MNGISSISFESKCIAYLEAIHRDKENSINGRAQCTGFFWRNNGVPYLITNRHCVTGKNEKNIRLDDSFPPIGLQIYFWVAGKCIDEDAHEYHLRAIEYLLWENSAPAWQEHPDGHIIDVVALKIDDFPDPIHCVNDKMQYEHWYPEAGTDCFIVGYPEGLSGNEGTPIWKRASIASEPDMPFDGKPLFLCDSATRPGMSGSPVFAKMLGEFAPGGNQFDGSKTPRFWGHWTKFLGVYSGRNGAEEDGFQLGRVWKANVIDEIIANSAEPSSPFIPQN